MNVSLQKLGSLISLLSLLFNLMPPLAITAYASEKVVVPTQSLQPETVVPFREPPLSTAEVAALIPRRPIPAHPTIAPTQANFPVFSAINPVILNDGNSLALSKPAFLSRKPEPPQLPAPSIQNNILPAWFNSKTPIVAADPAGYSTAGKTAAATVLPKWFQNISPPSVPQDNQPTPVNIQSKPVILPAWFSNKAGFRANPLALPPQRPLANPIPQVRITVEAPDSVSAGNFLGDTYTITVRNPSGNTGLNFYLEASIPNLGFAYVPGSAVWVSSVTGPIGYTDSYIVPQVVWTPNITRNLLPGEVVTLTFHMTTDGNAISGQRLDAWARYDFGGSPGENNAGANITVGRGNLVISKSPTLQDGTFGDVVSWDIEVANTGLGTVYSATVFDNFGSGYTNTNAGQLAIPAFHLEIGERRNFVVSATINSCTNLTNTGLTYWSIGNDEGGGSITNPASDTTDIAYLLEEPQITLQANAIAFDYCTPAPQTVTVTATNSAGPALNFTLASNLNSQPFTFTTPSGWDYNPATGVFAYTANGGVLTQTSVTLSFVVTPTFDVCSAADSGSFNFSPRYRDACGLNFTGSPVGVNYTYGAGQRPAFDLTKTGRDLQLFAGDTTEFYVDFDIQNVQNISGNIIITDIVPSALTITNVTAGGLGAITQNGNVITWTIPAPAGPGTFGGRITLTVQAQDVVTDCGTNSLAVNNASGQAPVRCPNCPPLSDSDSAEVYIQNVVGQAFPREISTDGQVCGLITVTNRYSMPVNSWAGVVFTETLGHNDGVPEDDVTPGTLSYVPGSLVVLIDGVNRTLEITIAQTAPQLVLDFSGVTAPTGTRSISIAYTLDILDSVLDGNPSISFFDWSILTVPGAGGSDQCAGGDTFYQGVPVELRRADLQINISPDSFNSCATVPVVLTVSDPNLMTNSLIARNIVVTFSVPSPDFGSISGNYIYGGGFFNNPVTVITGANLITWTFQNPLTQTGTTTGTISFSMTRSCTAPALQAGVRFDDRCLVNYGHTTTNPGTTVPPNLALFVTPDLYTVNENRASWRIYVTNIGGGAAGRTVITNTLGYGLQFENYSTNLPGQVNLLTPGPYSPGQTIEWEILNLQPGQQVRIDVDSAQVVDCGGLTSEIFMSSACLGDGSCPATQSDSLRFLIPPFAVRTSNAQTADLPFCDIGEATLVVKNSSATAHVYGLIITQSITALDYISGSSRITVADRFGTIIDGLVNIAFEPVTQTVATGTVLVWSLVNPGITPSQTQILAERAPEDTITVTFQVQTDCGTEGFNTVRSQAGGYHSCGTFFTSQENSDTIPKEQPDIGLTKVGRNVTAGDTVYNSTVFGEPGDVVVWQIVANNGIGAYMARNVVIVDTLPPNMDAIIPGAGVTDGLVTPTLGFVTWNLGDLPADGIDRTMWVTTTIDNEATACATSNINTATLTYGCDFSGGYCPGEPFVATATLRTLPDITAQTLNATPLNTCGGPITVTLTNNGPPAYNVYLTDTIPLGYLFDSTIFASTGPNITPTAGVTQAVWGWTGGITLPTGVTTLTFQVVNSATTDFCASVTEPPNQVDVSYDDNAVCTVTGPQTTTATSNLTVNSPNLQISKTPAFQVAAVGQTIIWTVTVNNFGSGDAFGVVVTDIAGSQYENLTHVSNSTGVPANFSGTHQITWAVGSIPAGGSWNTILTAVLTETGNNLNQADVSAECATGCTTNVASDTAYVSLLNDFDKSPNIQTGTIGSLVTFDLAATLSDFDGDYQNIILTDTLPAGLGYVSAALTYTANAEAGGLPTPAPAPTTPGQYNPGPIVWNLGNLPGVVEIEGTITAIILNNATNYNGARHTNNARLTYIQDGSPYDFNDTGDVDIVEPILHIGKSYVTPDNCQATLFQENFNAISNGSRPTTGWSYVNTTEWSVQNGVMVQNSILNNRRAFAGDLTWTDYSYSVMMLSSDTDNDDPFGVAFRVQNNTNYYRFVWRREATGWRQRLLLSSGTGVVALASTNAPSYDVGRWYHVEIRAEGSLLRVFVDGQQILSAIDATYASGRVGLYAHQNNNTYFDDMLVTRLNQSGCTVGANNLVTYTLAVSSQSALPGYDLVITDNIPAGMSLVTYTMSSNDPTNPAILSGPAPGATGTLVWTVDHLTATTTPVNHAALQLTVVLQVADNIPANTVLDNQALLSYDNWVTDTQPIPTIHRTSSGGSHSTAVRTVNGGIRKNILPIEPPPTATLGTLVTYTLIVPADPITATLVNVVVTDTLSLPRFYIENVIATGGTGALSSFNQATGQITATFATIPHGQQGVITITTRISHEFPAGDSDPNRGDVITNAAVMTHATATEITRTNEVSTTVYEPLLTITKTGAVVLGDPQAVDYTVRVTNIGDAVAYGPLVVHDLTPPGVTVTNISDGGQLLPDNRTISWTVGSLAIGAFVERTYRLHLTEAIYANNLFTNTAVVTNTSLTGTIPGVRPYVTNTVYTFPWPLGRLGNFVWVDRNYDGIQNDGPAAPIPGVVVDLYNSATGAYITSTTTGANGEYYFENLPLGITYTVQLSTVNFTGVLSPYFPTRLNAGGDTAIDSDASPNAIFNGAGYAITTTLTAAITQDLTLDYGFVPRMALGDQLWFDSDDDGVYDVGTEPPIPNVDVQLYRDINGNGLPEPGELISTTTTNGGGVYSFTNLLPSFYVTETYYVVITTSNFIAGGALEGYRPSTPVIPVDRNPASNNNNHGYTTGVLGSNTGFVNSTVITLTPYIEPDIYLGHNNANYTVDFGFLRTDLGDLPNSGVPEAGYAPQTYPTQLADNGPSHTILPGNNPTLGSQVDAETDGQPSLDADGDDVNNGDSYHPVSGSGDDEHGITFSGPLVPGEVLTITVTTLEAINGGADGNLSAWIDFDGDGVLEDGERIATDRNIPAGSTLDITITVPLTTAQGITTYSRFRLVTATQSVTLPTGHAASGEVEDYAIPSVMLDWGDLPEVTYNTTYASNGPRHIIDGTFLGQLVDAEGDGQPNIAANGDDAASSTMGAGTVPDDDEDGIIFLTPIVRGRPAQIQVIAGTIGYLNSWFDFDGDGTLDVFTITNMTGPGTSSTGPSNTDLHFNTPGVYTLTFDVPDVPISSSLYSRFRYTTNPGEANTPVGFAPTGEVEDYVLLSLGDLVWLDDGAGGATGNDGVYQIGQEQPISNVVLRLLDGAGVPLTDGSGNDITTTTAANGRYIFTGLNPGDYQVEVISSNFSTGGPLAGLLSSTDPVAGGNDPNNDENEDIDENGVDSPNPDITGIRSLSMTLTLGSEPTDDGDTDANSNLTLDFGFTPLMNLGNQVWFDTDDSGTLDFGEPPISDVVVILYRDTNGDGVYTPGIDQQQAVTTTNAGGYYTFTNLSPGGYVVVITSSNFITGNALAGYITSTTAVSGNSDANEENHGYLTGTPGAGGYVASTVVTLTAGLEPDDNGRSNYTIDFGFVRYDLGDLPEAGFAYPTTLANNGARHVILPASNPTLGSIVDAEPDGQPSVNANGDDGANSSNVYPNGSVPGDDEDGVTFSAGILTPGELLTITVSAGDTGGYLNAWIDLNGDGVLDDADRIAGGVAGSQFIAANSSINIAVIVPLTTSQGSLIYSRFRFSSLETLGPAGTALDGEVEDYVLPVGQTDWGDLPDDIGGLPDYNTLYGSNGPRHAITSGLQIGPQIDAESNGFPSANADGDDNDNLDDEDGVTLPPELIPGTNATFTVSVVNTTGTDAVLYGFIDWNADGDFDDANEVVTQTVGASGDVNLTYAIPANAAIDTPFGLRFRLSTDDTLGPDGYAPDGEIEDYMARIPPPILNFEKYVAPGSEVQPGDVLAYTLCYSNSGGAIATNVVITDDIPFNTTYIPGSVTVDSGAVQFHDGTGWVSPPPEPAVVTGIRWLVGDLAADGVTHCVDFNVTINMTLSDTNSSLAVMYSPEGWVVVAGDTTGMEIVGYTGGPTQTQPTPTPAITATPPLTPTLAPTPAATVTSTPLLTATPTVQPSTPTETPVITLTITGTPVVDTTPATITPEPTETATTIPSLTPTIEPATTPEIVTETTSPEPTPTITPTVATTASTLVILPPVIRANWGGSTGNLAQPALLRAQISPTDTAVTDTPTPLPTLTPTIEPTLTLEPTATSAISPTATVVEPTDTPTPQPTATATAQIPNTVTVESPATTVTPTIIPTVEVATPVIVTPEVTTTPVITLTAPVTDTPIAGNYAIVTLETVIIDIVNQAIIGSDQTPTQTATITKPVARVVDPAISKSVDPTRASPGETVRFYVTVDNPSPPSSNANATNVVVVDALPLTVDLVNYSLSSNPPGVISSSTVITNTVSTGHPTITQTVATTITVVIPVLAPGQQVFLNIETVVNSLASPPPQTINNSARLTFIEGAPRTDSSPPVVVPTPPRPGGDDDDDDDDDTPPPVVVPPAQPEAQPTLPVFYLPETGFDDSYPNTGAGIGGILFATTVTALLVTLLAWYRKRR